MGDLKFNLKADGIAYLYRSAFCLAKGEIPSFLSMLRKAQEKMGQDKLKKFKPLFENPNKYLSNKSEELFWAEKILDEYRYFFNLLHRLDQVRTNL